MDTLNTYLFYYICLVLCVVYNFDFICSAASEATCTKLHDKGVYTYRTSKTVLRRSGEMYIPLLIDFKKIYTFCSYTQEFSISDAFNFKHTINNGMHFDFPDHVSRRRRDTSIYDTSNYSHDVYNRKKRFAVLAGVVGFSVVSLIWGAINEMSVSSKVESIRNDIRDVVKTNIEANNITMENLIILKHKTQELEKAIYLGMCNGMMSILQVVVPPMMERAFDDLINAALHQSITTSIIHPDQMISLIREVPELTNTIFKSKPHLAYILGSCVLDLKDAPNKGYVKGVLTLPIIDEVVEPVIVRYLYLNSRNIDDDSLDVDFKRVVGPMYFGETSGINVNRCEQHGGFYICAAGFTDDHQYHMVHEDIISNDGLVVVNTEVKVKSYDRRGVASNQIGPLICDMSTTTKVEANGYMWYTRPIVLRIAASRINISDDIMNFTKIHFKDMNIPLREWLDKNAEPTSMFRGLFGNFGFTKYVVIFCVLFLCILYIWTMWKFPCWNCHKILCVKLIGMYNGTPTEITQRITTLCGTIDSEIGYLSHHNMNERMENGSTQLYSAFRQVLDASIPGTPNHFNKYSDSLYYAPLNKFFSVFSGTGRMNSTLHESDTSFAPTVINANRAQFIKDGNSVILIISNHVDGRVDVPVALRASRFHYYAGGGSSNPVR